MFSCMMLYYYFKIKRKLFKLHLHVRIKTIEDSAISPIYLLNWHVQIFRRNLTHTEQPYPSQKPSTQILLHCYSLKNSNFI